MTSLLVLLIRVSCSCTWFSHSVSGCLTGSCWEHLSRCCVTHSRILCLTCPMLSIGVIHGSIPERFWEWLFALFPCDNPWLEEQIEWFSVTSTSKFIFYQAFVIWFQCKKKCTAGRINTSLFFFFFLQPSFTIPKLCGKVALSWVLRKPKMLFSDLWSKSPLVKYQPKIIPWWPVHWRLQTVWMDVASEALFGDFPVGLRSTVKRLLLWPLRLDPYLKPL